MKTSDLKKLAAILSESDQYRVSEKYQKPEFYNIGDPSDKNLDCTRSEAMQIDFNHINDTCEAYKKYLIAKWRHDKLPPKWINREQPLWYNY